MLRAARSALATTALFACGAVLATATAAAEPFTLRSDLSYDLGSPPADPALNQLDIYSPASVTSERPAPVVVYAHGGSHRKGDKGNGVLEMARLFTGEGYLFVSVNYRLSPDPPDSSIATRIRYPAHPHDLGEAVGWLRRNVSAWGGDPSRLILAGHSAGAHLASLVATDGSFLRAYGTSPDAVRGVVALDAASYDLLDRADPATSTLRPAGLEGLWNAFATPLENALDRTWLDASPTHQGDRRDPPHLLVTQAAKAIRIAANESLATALEQDGGEVVAVDLSHSGIKSALGDPADSSGETEAVTEFVRDALATDAAPATKLRRRPAKRIKLRKGKRATVGFRFSTSDARARFECRIDQRRWRRCGSPKRYELGTGKHRFRVRSKNRDGKGEIRSYRFRIKR
jgi:acetyl esterase/lipase